MKTCKLLREQVAAATGSKKAELVLKNEQIVNVFTQSVETGDIHKWNWSSRCADCFRK